MYGCGMAASMATTNETTIDLSNNNNNVTSGMAVVMYDFEARFDDELSVRNGDSVKVVEIVDENWAKCQHLATNACGIVPQSFLQIFLDNDDMFAQTLPTFEESSSPATLSYVSSAPMLTGMESTTDMTREIPWNVDIFSSASSISAAPASNPLPPHSTADRQKIESSKTADSSTKSVKSKNVEKSTKTKKNSIKLHPTLPLIQPFSHEEKAVVVSDMQLQQDDQPPPRPPPPLILQSTGYSSQKSIALPKVAGLNNLPSDFQDQKSKVIQDLLLTETTYLFDLNSWETCITSSTSLSDEQKKILNNGLPHLKALSKKLIDNIKVEKGKSSDSQFYGQVFMEMREDFYRTFSYHCRSVELISQILENTTDVGLQESLNNCVTEMRKMGSNVFDVPTALSRPIHRCLKYPLYVSELLKYTPLNHIDHPKLMESLKQLGNLASKMNECKRRKELIRKYLDDQQLSLTERLSRISVHSLVKKSNRLKYRISSTIGLKTVRDSEFDYLISQLDGAERRVCKFLYCAQLYKKNMEVTFKKYEDSFKGPSPAENERLLKILPVFLGELDTIRKDFFRNFETIVLDEGKKLVRCDYTKLVHKRCDKLADYETAKATNKNSDEVEMRRNEYEALNNQVKSGLPKLISTINKKVVDLVHCVHEIDGKLLTAMDSLLFSHRQDKENNALFKDAQMFSQFVLALLGGNRFSEMNKVLRTRTHNASADSNREEIANGGGGEVALKVQGSRIVTRRTASLKTKQNSAKASPFTYKLSAIPNRQKSFTASTVEAKAERKQKPKECVKKEENLIDLGEDVIDLTVSKETGKSTFFDVVGGTQPSPDPPTIFSSAPTTRGGENEALKLIDYDCEPSSAITARTAADADFKKKWDFLFD